MKRPKSSPVKLIKLSDTHIPAEWRRIIAQNVTPPIAPDEITAQMFAEAAGITSTKAGKILYRLEKSGKATSQYKITPSGKREKAYRVNA